MLVVIDVIVYRFDRNDTSSSHVTYAGDVQEEFSAHMTFVFKRQYLQNQEKTSRLWYPFLP